MTVTKVRTRVSVGDHAIEDFDAYLDELGWADAERIENLYQEGNFEDWLAGVDARATRARRVLAWVVEHHHDPALRFDAMTSPMRALRITNLAQCPRCASEQAVGRREKDDVLLCLSCGTDVEASAPPAAPTPTVPAAPASGPAGKQTKRSSPTSSGSEAGSGPSSASTRAFGTSPTQTR